MVVPLILVKEMELNWTALLCKTWFNHIRSSSSINACMHAWSSKPLILQLLVKKHCRSSLLQEEKTQKTRAQQLVSIRTSRLPDQIGNLLQLNNFSLERIKDNVAAIIRDDHKSMIRESEVMLQRWSAVVAASNNSLCQNRHRKIGRYRWGLRRRP